MTIRAHILTPILPHLLLKQSPGRSTTVGNVSLSFGLTIPSDADVLIVYFYPEVSFNCNLPREHMVYFDAEPDAISTPEPDYMKQFGHVLTISQRELDTNVIRSNYCAMWYAGMNFKEAPNFKNVLDHDYFDRLEIPAGKQDKISVVTTRKNLTHMHQLRAPFIEALQRALPERVDVFGSNSIPLDDKRDALKGYKYNLALENSLERHSWTEKLADPLLFWTYPFHAGCQTARDYLDPNAFMTIDISAPEESARLIADAMNNNVWAKSLDAIGRARRSLLDEHNIIRLFCRLANVAMDTPVTSLTQTTVIADYRLRPIPEKMSKRIRWHAKILALKFIPDADLRYRRFKTSRGLKLFTDPGKKLRYRIRKVIFRSKNAED